MPPDEAIRAAVHALTGHDPSAVTRLKGGANNVVARVEVAGRVLVAKYYFTHPGDPRDRLGTEFRTLQFLWERGVRDVAEPVAASRELGVALYGYVAGEQIASHAATAEDAGMLADFFVELREVAADPLARNLAPASEAFFSLQAYLDGLDHRLERLRAALAGARAVAEASAYVAHELAPALAATKEFVRVRARELGISLDREAPPEERTLSPGDIGLHNALRRADGRLVFLDFEYAGWDTVANVAASLCLPPGVPVPPHAHLPTMRRYLDAIAAPPAVRVHLRLLYPLLALKWSLILLNEFVPIDSARRAFSGVAPKALRPAQLLRSRRLLEQADEASSDASFVEQILAAVDAPAGGRAAGR